MMDFRKTIKRIRSGTTVKTEAAICHGIMVRHSPALTSYVSEPVRIMTEITWYSELDTARDGQTYEFQELMKERIAMVMRVGLARGAMTFQRNSQSLFPSTFAAK